MELSENVCIYILIIFKTQTIHLIVNIYPYLKYEFTMIIAYSQFDYITSRFVIFKTFEWSHMLQYLID